MEPAISKLRRALVVYLASTTDNVYDGKASGEKSAPCVICNAENAVEDPLGSGNFWVDAEVGVKTIGAVDTDEVDPKTDSDTLESSVLALLDVDDLADQLTAAIPDFTVMGFAAEREIVQDREEDCFVSTWKRRVYCAASDLS